MLMTSQASGRANGFKNWSIAHSRGSNDDDHPGWGMPIAIAVPVLDEPMLAAPEPPHRPWIVPGRDTL
jgi:hypothetical protein